jgi:predicted membrane protein
MNKKSNVIVGLSVVGVVGLGILSMVLFGGSSDVKQPVKGIEVVQSDVVETSTKPSSGSFVASKQGKKYFPVDCGTAKAIKEENKVYFGSEAEAVSAGYERSLTCK